MKKLFFLLLPWILSAEEACPKKLELYYSPWCPYSRKVLNYLDQIHKTVAMKNVYETAEAKKELKELGGLMQVPCLMIEGKALYNADAIIEWFSEHQPCLY